MRSNQECTDHYVLGRSPQETLRLLEQARRFDPLTRQLFAEAGIGPGMRVLDLGTGAGSVALLLAELVGPSGSVVSVDSDPTALRSAQRMADYSGYDYIDFRCADISALTLDGTFDAIAGRFILMYLRDPVQVLSRCRHHVRSGGVVAFHECDWTQSPYATPSSPLLDHVWGWILQAFQHSGADVNAGARLSQLYRRAGLPAPCLQGERDMGGRPGWYGFGHITGLLRSVLPVVVSARIATEAEVDIDTLEDRLRAEILNSYAVITHQLLVRAWARVP